MPRLTSADILRMTDNHPALVAQLKGRNTPAKADDGMNATERAYARHLDGLKAAGAIGGWWFEQHTIKLAHRTTYTPDFVVWHAGGLVEIVEIKGFEEDDAIVKFKAAAAITPWARFTMIKYQSGEWVRTRELNVQEEAQ